MAITVIELRDKLNAAVHELEDQSFIMSQLGMNALEMIKKRVINKGENADGQQFPAYSTKPMLVGKKSFKTDAAFNKIAGSKKKRKELKWVTLGGSDQGLESYLSVSAGGQGPSASGDTTRLFELPQGYKQFRELHSRQTKHVDFAFSNDMWNDITLKSSSEDHRSGLAVIGAVEGLQKKKLAGNTERKGEILNLSKSEIDILVQDYDAFVARVFKSKGLQ